MHQRRARTLLFTIIGLTLLVIAGAAEKQAEASGQLLAAFSSAPPLPAGAAEAEVAASTQASSAPAEAEQHDGTPGTSAPSWEEARDNPMKSRSTQGNGSDTSIPDPASTAAGGNDEPSQGAEEEQGSALALVLGLEDSIAGAAAGLQVSWLANVLTHPKGNTKAKPKKEEMACLVT